jgi:hypothetical protein
MQPKTAVCRIFFPLQTAKVSYFQRKIQSGISAYPDGSSSQLIRINEVLMYILPIPVAARSKVWVYGRCHVGITGSNPAGGMDVCLCSVLCVVR